MRALVVEDDKRIASFVRRGLREQSFAVDLAREGETGQALALSETYDVIILDILLPKVGGKDILGSIRANGIRTPVIMLTAVDSVPLKVELLDMGADDYVTKPFSSSELLARVRSVMRRSAGQPESQIKVADLVLDPAAHRVTRAKRKIELTAKEYSLLHLLMENAGHPVTRTMIIEHVWDRNFDSFTNVVDVHVSRLRAKIDRDFGTQLIRTIKGVGYVLKDEE